LVDSGYSAGQSFSFHWSCPAGMVGPCGMNLFQPFGLVPPTVPTLPVSTVRKNSARATIQPPRFPAVAARQVWAASRPSARATVLASSSTCSTGTCASSAANAKV
jgi:hypothetical protein